MKLILGNMIRNNLDLTLKEVKSLKKDVSQEAASIYRELRGMIERIILTYRVYYAFTFVFILR